MSLDQARTIAEQRAGISFVRAMQAISHWTSGAALALQPDNALAATIAEWRPKDDPTRRRAICIYASSTMARSLPTHAPARRQKQNARAGLAS
ncbi:hypothetical protein [Candidatus Roseilinea sp. NK_OTU-006]|uniref:hypothetical protein n=1 Tax=Candidatus Roseilinea sp. NK_OTU-006 TaxID=2704250 RepID=UPI00145C87BF|nr:hypothetical protein [Candidatus Roseilinea sp. NK_OTU-006]